MNKSIYCVKHEWINASGETLERISNTHSWFTGINAAREEFLHRCEILYSHNDDRKVVPVSTNMDWDKNDGTYELCATKVYAHETDAGCIRVVLAAADLR